MMSSQDLSIEEREMIRRIALDVDKTHNHMPNPVAIGMMIAAMSALLRQLHAEASERNDKPAATPHLWSDTDIINEANAQAEALDGDALVRHLFRQSLMKMRGDYEAKRHASDTREDTFATFDRVCGCQLEFMLDRILGRTEAGTDEWIDAYVIRHFLTDMRKSLE